MPQSVSVSFRIPAEKARLIDQLSQATARSRSWLLEQALDAYLESQSWQVTHIEKGLDELQRGDSVPHETAVDIIERWGTDDERAPSR